MRPTKQPHVSDTIEIKLAADDAQALGLAFALGFAFAFFGAGKGVGGRPILRKVSEASANAWLPAGTPQ